LANQAGDLLGRQGAQFGQIGQHGHGGDRADALEALHETRQGFAGRAGLDGAGQGLLDGSQIAYQAGNGFLEAGLNDRMGRDGQPAALGLELIDELAAAGGKLAQIPIAGNGRARVAASTLFSREGRDQPGIDAVGLGLDAAAVAIGDHCVGVNAREGNPSCLEFALQGALIAPRRLESDESGTDRIQPGSDSVRRIGEAPAMGLTGHCPIKPVFGHVHANNDIAHRNDLLHTLSLVGTQDCIRAISPFYRTRVRP
jgi:hypothetical protein